jgi:hypothetical protein
MPGTTGTGTAYSYPSDRDQPGLADHGTVAAIVGQALGVGPRP